MHDGSLFPFFLSFYISTSSSSSSFPYSSHYVTYGICTNHAVAIFLCPSQGRRRWFHLKEHNATTLKTLLIIRITPVIIIVSAIRRHTVATILLVMIIQLYGIFKLGTHRPSLHVPKYTVITSSLIRRLKKHVWRLTWSLTLEEADDSFDKFLGSNLPSPSVPKYTAINHHR